MLDWGSLKASLTTKGYVLIRELLGADICESLRKMFHEDGLYGKTVVMNKGRFGRGCYRYFAAPIPESVDAIRRIVYPFVAQIANSWQQMLITSGTRYVLGVPFHEYQ